MKLWDRIARKAVKEYRYLRRNRRHTVYHCCIQKSASQWFMNVFRDPLMWRHTRLPMYNPGVNFVPREPDKMAMLSRLPTGVIVSPFYVRYEDFRAMPKPEVHRAVYIMRDPRDLVVSDYFSLKYSHKQASDYYVRMREMLAGMTQEEGIMQRIRNFSDFFFDVLRGWSRAGEDPRIRLFRFEDLFTPVNRDQFRLLFDHCRLPVPDAVLDALLARYSFERKSGRTQGTEDVGSHYRKGIAGDWRNYFTDGHRAVFKQEAGPLLVELGYEPGLDW